MEVRRVGQGVRLQEPGIHELPDDFLPDLLTHSDRVMDGLVLLKCQVRTVGSQVPLHVFQRVSEPPLRLATLVGVFLVGVNQKPLEQELLLKRQRIKNRCDVSSGIVTRRVVHGLEYTEEVVVDGILRCVW